MFVQDPLENFQVSLRTGVGTPETGKTGIPANRTTYLSPEEASYVIDVTPLGDGPVVPVMLVHAPLENFQVSAKALG